MDLSFASFKAKGRKYLAFMLYCLYSFFPSQEGKYKLCLIVHTSVSNSKHFVSEYREEHFIAAG